MLVQTVGLVHIDHGVLQKERQAVAAEQGGANPVGRRVGRIIADELRAVLDDVEVVVAQHLVFDCIVHVGQQVGQIQLLLFAEVIEDRRVIRGAGIEGPLDGMR